MDYQTLKDLVEEKLSCRQIAERTCKSSSTVKKWLKKHGLQTINSSNEENDLRCQKCNKPLRGKQKKFCSKNCQVIVYVTKHRQKIKRKAVEYKGGKCEICGYNKNIWSLAFHHIDPSKKDFSISDSGNSYGWESVKKEIDKCILVCLNCHGEIHYETS